MSRWKNIPELYDYLNNYFEYLVLRNWDKNTEAALYSGREDIDILCSDKHELVQAIEARPIYKSTELFCRSNYVCVIDGHCVRLDIRDYNDDYYDSAWCKIILKNRRQMNGSFYVPDKTNYFYSLAYHSLFQKRNVSNENKIILESLSSDIGLNYECFDENVLLNDLLCFLMEHNFKVTLPKDCGVFFNFDRVNKAGIKYKTSLVRIVDRKLFDVYKHISVIGRGLPK